MKRKGFITLTLILCLLLCISVIGCNKNKDNGSSDNSGSGESGGSEPTIGLEYSLTEDGTYMLVGMGACTDTNIIIPSTYNSLPVTHVSSQAFEDCANLESLFIPEFVVSIDAYGFEECTALKKIDVDANNTTYTSVDGNLYKKEPMSLEFYAPGKTETEFTVPNGVVAIGSSAFSASNSLNKIILPDTITSVIRYSFNGCDGLQYNVYQNAMYLGSNENPYLVLIKAASTEINSCEINSGTKVIGGYAFNACSNLESISVPDNVTTICAGAFTDCSELTSIKLSGNIKSIEDYLFSGCSSLVSLEIPEGVTHLGYAFDDCERLSNLSIPSTISSLSDNDVLFGLNSLMYNRYENASYLGNAENPYVILVRGGSASVIHPDTKIIYKNAFEGKDITSITIPDSVVDIQCWAFAECELLESVEIGSGVKNIGYCAFENCTSLKSIVIPDNVLNLGYNAFTGCVALESVTLGNGISKIMAQTFANCVSLTNVEIPSSVKSISAGAFGGCTGLTEITIPSGVTEIANAFYRSNIQSINVASGNTKYKTVDGSLYTLDGKTLVCYAPGKTDTEFTIPSGVVTIGNDAFERNLYLKKVIISNGTEHIGSSAFAKCSALETVILADSVITISHEAFENCMSLKNVQMSSNIKVIGQEAFQDTSVIYNEYKNGAYMGNDENPYVVLASAVNNRITSCVVNENTRVILDNAFKGCQSLTKLFIPQNVIYVGETVCRSSTTTIYCQASSKPITWDSSWNKRNCPVEWGYTAGDDFFDGDQSGTGVTLEIVGSEITKDQWEQMRNTDNYTVNAIASDGVTATEYRASSNALYVGIPGHEAYICEKDGTTYNIVNVNNSWVGVISESYDFTIQGTLLSIITDKDTFDSMRFDSTKGCYKYVFNDAPVQGEFDITRSGIYEFYFIDGIIAAIVLLYEESEAPQIVYFSNVGTTEPVEVPAFSITMPN